MTIFEQIERDLMRHEGFRSRVYDCGTGAAAHGSVGKLTVGYGRNLESRGVNRHEAVYLLRNDIHRCHVEAAALVKNWNQLDPVRKGVVVNMVFQLGGVGFAGFKRMRRALGQRDYDTAAREMMDSNWAQQTPERARELAARMRTGRISGGSDD